MDKISVFLFFVLFAILLWMSAGAAKELNLKRNSAALFQMVVVPVVYALLCVTGYFIKECLIILFS